MVMLCVLHIHCQSACLLCIISLENIMHRNTITFTKTIDILPEAIISYFLFLHRLQF